MQEQIYVCILPLFASKFCTLESINYAL